MDELYSIADLVRELGVPEHEMTGVQAWTGENAGLHEKVFTRAWLDEMIEEWRADAKRIAEHG